LQLAALFFIVKSDPISGVLKAEIAAESAAKPLCVVYDGTNFGWCGIDRQSLWQIQDPGRLAATKPDSHVTEEGK
jgi:hypothetical protein